MITDTEYEYQLRENDKLKARIAELEADVKKWQEIAVKHAVYEEQADVKITELEAKLAIDNEMKFVKVAEVRGVTQIESGKWIFIGAFLGEPLIIGSSLFVAISEPKDSNDTERLYDECIDPNA